MNENEKKKGSISQLMEYAGRHKTLTILGCILSGVSAVLGLVPYICIWLVARGIFSSETAANDLQGLIKYGWIALAVAILGMLIYFAALMCTHIAAFRTAKNMRLAAARHLVDVPLGYFSANQSGRLKKMIDDNAGMTEGLLAHHIPDAVGAAVTPVAAVILLFVFDWRMGLICLLPMLFSVFMLTRMLGGEKAGFFAQYQKAIENLSGEATEYVRGVPVVKVFQQTVYSFKTFYSAIMDYKKLAADYAMSCRNPMTAFTTSLNAIFLLLIPAGLILCGMASDGWTVLVNFIFYILFTPMCAFMMSRLMYASESFMQADEAVRKLDEILDTSPLPETSTPERSKDATIEFIDVSFSYPESTTHALNHVSFQIPEKKTLALVGPSGSGKSTAASLIPRFWDVQDGAVLVGGVDVRKLSSSELMNQVSFVFQDTHLFKTSLLENIKAARPDASREQVLQAAHAAQCDDILEKMPDGLDTVVGTKGIYLSGGECQRIALARAILKDAPIIVLDEATAFSDPENEALIQKAFETLTKNKTVLMIAHRLSTIQTADCILVFKEGQIVESGSHDDLLSKDGLYKAMWNDYQTSAQWKIGKETHS